MKTKTRAVLLLAGAWVLWLADYDFKGEPQRISEWQPLGGYPTYELCEQATVSHSLREIARFKTSEKSTASISQCLPDTIDPRAPKAKDN
jgi:hypothetical protein